MITEYEQDLINKHTFDDISDEEFLSKYPHELRGTSYALSELKEGVESKNAVQVCYALNVAWFQGMTPDHRSVLCDLAFADYHESHEEVIGALDSLLLPDTVELFYRRAVLPLPAYLEWDDNHVLQVKCTYALCNIHTAEAHQKLGRLLNHEAEPVREKAEELLNRWDTWYSGRELPAHLRDQSVG